ncbi:heat stress transcription factor A-1b-like [Impatiens glandulifera]|uniref:heat stress transcription factor A-1b-like n=1 Tax=Impatiens glandulifera TaxID=253017 RepID=UPI001FB0E37B|nr:heat stress transcription factor A-1b-like [Impatiens glandulifera]
MATVEVVSTDVYNPILLPPFLSKLYEIVDDPLTNDIISWGPTNRTFIVWKPYNFYSILFKYFNHSNFSSFGKELHRYCFNKVHHTQWEFAHETGFVRGKPHLMMNIVLRTRSRDHSSKNPGVMRSSPLLCTYPKKQWKRQELSRAMNQQDIIVSSSSNVPQSSELGINLELENINRKRKLELFEGTLKEDEHVGAMLIPDSFPEYNDDDNIVWADIPPLSNAQEIGNNNIALEQSENNKEDDSKREEESIIKMWERFLMETD